jgi:hypothetical protein
LIIQAFIYIVKINLDQIANSNLLLTNQAAKAIENLSIIEGVGTGTAGTGAATMGIAQSGIVSAATAASAASTGPVVLALGGIILFGGLIYGGVEAGIAIRNSIDRAKKLRRSY